MKKFTLTTIIAIIALGFYHASTMIDNDIVARNGQANLSEIKEGVADDINETVSESVESAQGAVVKAVDDSDVSLGLSKSSVSGSVVDSLLFDKDQSRSALTLSETKESNESEIDEILKYDRGDTEAKNRLKIIEIYKETPQIFDVEVLKEYLEGSEYSQEDYIKAICEQVE